MSAPDPRLTTRQMAHFAARGLLRLDGVVPAAINDAFLAQARDNALPEVPAGTPLDKAYAPGSPLHDLIELPRVRGALESLVGPHAIFDHHFLHIAFPPAFFARRGLRQAAQPTHQDSTIDPRVQAFDVQLFYFPHAVAADMGGTRFLPGSHLRRVSESATARYQNLRGQEHVVCPAGTVLFFHHGLWHGGGRNRSDQVRYMFKLRLNPSVRQCRLWNTADLRPRDLEQRPIFWRRDPGDPEHLHNILCRLEPWYEADTGRLELINRIRFWRYLLGDPHFDADYWLSRLEASP